MRARRGEDCPVGIYSLAKNLMAETLLPLLGFEIVVEEDEEVVGDPCIRD